MTKTPNFAYVAKRPAANFGNHLAQITRDGKPALLVDRARDPAFSGRIRFTLSVEEADRLGQMAAAGPAALAALAEVLGYARSFVDDWEIDVDRDERADFVRACRRLEAAESLLAKFNPVEPANT